MAGQLIYIIGASGSGKDTLISYAREKLAGTSGVCFAHRYITRAAHAGHENHVALSADEFAARVSAGLFAMHWSSYGLSYGIGIEIDRWLAGGQTVIVNGSRRYLDQARAIYPTLLPVVVDVSVEVLRERLLARGREDSAAIEARLQRHAELESPPKGGITIQNNGPITDAGEQLVALVRRCQSQASACA